MRMYSCFSVGSGSSMSSSENPMMAFSGVRSSWLMLARKSDFMRSDSSARTPGFLQFALGALLGRDVAHGQHHPGLSCDGEEIARHAYVAVDGLRVVVGGVEHHRDLQSREAFLRPEHPGDGRADGTVGAQFVCAADAGVLAVLAAQLVAHLGRCGFRSGSRRGAIVGLQNVEIGVDQQQVGGYVAEYAVVDPVACSDVPALVADTDGQEDAKRRQHPFPITYNNCIRLFRFRFRSQR